MVRSHFSSFVLHTDYVTGVRNPAAAKNMRAMKKGDLAFFYASGGKQGRSPGITGIMEIVSEAQFDVTTADKSSAYYVADEKKRDKWCAVGVQFSKKLTKPVSLKEIQRYGKDKGVLSELQLLKQMRLSVGKVSEKEWKFIVDNLVEEGYEEGSDEANDVSGAEKVDEKVVNSDESNIVAAAEHPGESMADDEILDDTNPVVEDAELPTVAHVAAVPGTTRSRASSRAPE